MIRDEKLIILVVSMFDINIYISTYLIGCGTSFCYLCKNYWHGGLSCEQAAERVFRGIMSGDGRNDADPRLPSSSSSVNASTQTGAGAKRFDAIEALGIDPKSADGEIKCCPRCSALIVKLNDGIY